MTWTLSHFRAGDLVEVLSKEEILATLDKKGCVEELPFMPEMLQFCGKRFYVRAVAHKTCETARKTWKGRCMHATVHLDNLRCDGSSHGGCEAACSLFWKDVWLKAVNENISSNLEINPSFKHSILSEDELLATTQLPKNTGEEPCYSCQTTRLYDATQPLEWWDLRQYFFDVTTGNHSFTQVLRVTFLGSLRGVVSFFKRGYGFNNWMHRLLSNRPSPSLSGKVKLGDKTPEGVLNLQPGELVRIKSQSEIEETINERGLNRGLSFNCDEMVPYCGRVFRVRSLVAKILDEETGKMLYMKQPCIILEGVYCNAEFSACRLNCPRAIPHYWREIWLERVSKDDPKFKTGIQGSEKNE